MPRPPIVLQSEFPYHITARCINKDWFKVPMSTVWDIMSNNLFFIHHTYKVKIFAFVLMSNHFHLIIQTPDANLSETMAWFMRETSRSLTKAGNRINQTYGSRYYRSIIKTSHYYLNAYKYVYHNPIQGGLCKHILDYPYSTLPGLLGLQHTLIPTEEDLTLFSNIGETIEWINRKPTPDHWTSVRLAIQRPEFKLSRLRNKKANPLEYDTL